VENLNRGDVGSLFFKGFRRSVHAWLSRAFLFPFCRIEAEGAGRNRPRPLAVSGARMTSITGALSARLAQVGDAIGGWWKVYQQQAAAREEPVFSSHSPEITRKRGDAPPVSGLTQPRLNTFLSLGPHGFHRIAYTEWGDPANTHVIVCMHGFTRNSRDFDVLAARMADHCRVVCMDVVGRGASDWLKHKEDYDYSLYLSDAAALLARIMTSAPGTGKGDAALRVDWIGTSMGGLVGMILAAKSHTPLQRLVLNDIGPLVPWPALARLKSIHSRSRQRFKNLSQVESYLREIYSTFGPLDDERWRHVVCHSARQLDDGDYVLAYDPDIMSSLHHARRGIEFGTDFVYGVDLWPVWDRVRCPTLVLRGGTSDMLLRSTSEQMKRRGPKAQVVELPGIGHAPWLMTDDQNDIISDFLLAPVTSE
jgi:pimeloyl-ACP methyl ester carboxylesterase